MTELGAERPNGDLSTRHQVLHLLLSEGAMTAPDLACRLSITPTAVRRHLTGLIKGGQVVENQPDQQPSRGRGRPAKTFQLTDLGRSAFNQAYDDLAMQALRVLVETMGADAVTKLGEKRYVDVEQRYRGYRAARPLADPVEALASALNDDGYVTKVDEAPAGAQLCQHHCPVAHVAAEFPQLCEAETQMFSRLLGTRVQRLATIAHGDGVCTTNIPLDIVVIDHEMVIEHTPRERKRAVENHRATDNNREATSA
ncbi:Transcriptional regulator, ArsR family [Propionibacterium freudenreichii]|uniref:helix-turn-helix transcriptional regulator n=1 Tax=Propionibacterium freudenreichii TaxID=1744 RepID=UPI000BC321C5|nr:metalloregulator ArsR/SmtB family transcription factor [Propionibacterium freudenreichii]SBN59720.1 Transcriptional regulator, ArsR family [Propionibacterium freudenreichii]SBN95177.1 Transcriptional regulator, ArsR family [Propionibacterium freudenreichii]SCC96763.1 Transcriptional regulator, ArsR family [Propionibacterium freudenreichii]SCQ48160.1 Transcriptional regulator, ArsR family [Propionibacterium freudenreichii]SCQ52468.1 Transcriptional regulator, ArsR family [Propionibacterium f